MLSLWENVIRPPWHPGKVRDDEESEIGLTGCFLRLISGSMLWQKHDLLDNCHGELGDGAQTGRDNVTDQLTGERWGLQAHMIQNDNPYRGLNITNKGSRELFCYF